MNAKSAKLKFERRCNLLYTFSFLFMLIFTLIIRNWHLFVEMVEIEFWWSFPINRNFNCICSDSKYIRIDLAFGLLCVIVTRSLLIVITC
jgi:hypothetical protein